LTECGKNTIGDGKSHQNKRLLNRISGAGMEKSEEKIIDLVDVIAEPDPNRVPKALPVAAPEKRVEFPSESGNKDFGKMV
jgi:hypothetical protein